MRPASRKTASFSEEQTHMATLGVSEVKERSGFRHDFLGIPDFHRFRGKGTIFRVPKNITFWTLFSENCTLTVSVKTSGFGPF